MRNIKLNLLIMLSFVCMAALTLIISSCSKNDNSLAPYAGSPEMYGITLQAGSFTPKINWIGGYVSVVGVNKGIHAALDSSLIWIIYMPGNQIHYPVEYGSTPSGAQNLTTHYGGTPMDTLIEDSTYTFWVMKDAQWTDISAMQNKIIVLDSSLATSFNLDADTARFSPEGHTQKTRNLDNFINITDFHTVGKLADITVEQPRTSNNPKITWHIKQPGVTDSLISAIGITEGDHYIIDAVVWEVYSVSDSAGGTYYGKVNIIPSPVIAGQEYPGTYVFTPYLEGGLLRGRTYNIWIANRYWNGEGRSRITPYYAYAYFKTY